MSINSKQKGKRGELEASHALNTILSVTTRRSQQYCGTAGDADVIGVEGLHLEVKRTEKFNLYGAMEQAVRDCGNKEIPTVMHRKNRKDWVMVVRAEDVVEFAKAILATQE